MQPPGEQRISLHHRRVLREVFSALAKARLESPGLPVTASELIAAGWPETKPTAVGITNRLHVAIWTLRDLGLRMIVQNAPTGYLLDPEVPIRVEG